MSGTQLENSIPRAAAEVELQRLDNQVNEIERESNDFVSPSERWKVNVTVRTARQAVATARTASDITNAALEHAQRTIADARRAVDRGIAALTNMRPMIRLSSSTSPAGLAPSPRTGAYGAENIKDELDHHDKRLEELEVKVFSEVLQSSLRSGALNALKAARDVMDPTRTTCAQAPVDGPATRYTRGAIDIALVRRRGPSVLADVNRLLNNSIAIAQDAINEEKAINDARQLRIDQRVEEARQEIQRQQQDMHQQSLPRPSQDTSGNAADHQLDLDTYRAVVANGERLLGEWEQLTSYEHRLHPGRRRNRRNSRQLW